MFPTVACDVVGCVVASSVVVGYFAFLNHLRIGMPSYLGDGSAVGGAVFGKDIE